MINVGIIGFGRIGRVHLESLAHYVKNAKAVAIADPFIDCIDAAVKAQAKSFGVKAFYADYREILNDPKIDAVFICSSTDTHAKISIEAIKAGKHVFCEKPVDHEVKAINEVKAALKGSKLKYQVGFNRRFDHNFRAAREAYLKGQAGELTTLKITSRDPGAPPVAYIKVSGGIFLDMTIHDFDMARYISGAEVEEVFAYGTVTVDKAIAEAGDIDTALISMKLKGGALAVIDNCRRASYGYDQRIEVFGSRGQIDIKNDSASTVTVSDADGVTSEKPLYFFLERYMQAYAAEIIEFAEAIEKDTPVPVGIEDGLQAVRIALAAKKSLAEGRAVKLSEIEG
ncbi:MAG: inositol 2-dehydrogenase [Clostridiaceae bacterium]|jgi:myo-inositol 2-dehydrogenase/D-chiro-inositol 1-dehydrogenase|nr:inositol 2-dehydrogenase [Clostridiaceae bacterium]